MRSTLVVTFEDAACKQLLVALGTTDDAQPVFHPLIQFTHPVHCFPRKTLVKNSHSLCVKPYSFTAGFSLFFILLLSLPRLKKADKTGTEN